MGCIPMGHSESLEGVGDALLSCVNIEFLHVVCIFFAYLEVCELYSDMQSQD